MSEAQQQIVCRKCREVIPFETGGCPHCGKSVRNRWRWAAVTIIGLILGISAAIGGFFSFAALGMILAGVGIYVLWDQRQRIQQADEREDADQDVIEEGTGAPEPEAE